MNNLYDVLETCLQELENGVDVDAVIARYPRLAGELRPILMASIEARTRGMDALDPSPETVRRGRAKLLQRASEMREVKLAPRRRVIPFFQRLAISFTLTTLFLASGTGLVGASSTALPGENLYKVKLTWENVRLFFTFDHDAHELLEHAFENERLHEINELLTEGRDEDIYFSGVYMEVNGLVYVAGIRVVILGTTILPANGLVNGAAVAVTGHTNSAGFVDAESVELLPPGTAVPAGEPVKVEKDQNDDNINDDGNNNGNVNVNVNGNVNENDDTNDNGNVNENDNTNDNGNVNSNNNDNGSNDNGDGNGNDDGNDDDGDGGGGNDNNANDNTNDNVNDNANDNTNDNANDNANDNVNDNTNDNTNDNANDNVNDNTNDNANDNVNDNTNDNTNVNDNDNINDNTNDNGNDDNINDGNSNDGDNANENDNGNDGNSNDDDNTNDDDDGNDNSDDGNSNDDDNSNDGGVAPAFIGRMEVLHSRKYFARK